MSVIRIIIMTVVQENPGSTPGQSTVNPLERSGSLFERTQSDPLFGRWPSQDRGPLFGGVVRL